MAAAARWKATVHVGGLAPMVTSEHVYDAFLPFGEIVDVTVPKNDNPRPNQDPNVPPETHRGFAYVEYEDADDAKEAIDNMDQSDFFGRLIRVSAAKAPKSAEEGLGSKTAIWEQEGWLAQHAAGEEGMPAADPMQGLEGLDVAGPKRQ